MALEFYYAEGRKFNSVLFTLDDIEFETLDLVAPQLKRLTGLVIDQYGKTRLHRDHVQLIVDLIDLHRMLPDVSLKLNEKLLSVKEKLSSVNADLIAIGD